MRFVGGLNRANSRFFRYQPNRVVMEVGKEEVTIRLGGGFGFLDGPWVWNTLDLEFNRQPRRINSYVGLRTRGGNEWTWFQTRSVSEVCVSLASVGATEVDASPLRTMDLLPMTLQGSALVAGVGLLILLASQLLNIRGTPAAHALGGFLQLVGVMSAASGIAFLAIHLWGRRRSGTGR
jgi:hypothetical protein